MRKIFDLENPLMQGLSTMADMLVLNLLALLCSLPLVTMGAAMTAMNDMVIHIVRQEERSLVRGFFRSFRQNLKSGIVFGLLLILATALLWFDYLCALTYAPPLRYGIAALAVLVLAVSLYVFALLARYENTLAKTIRNAAALSVAYFPQTLGMVLFTAALWLICIHFWRYGTPVLIMFGFSLPCYVILMKKMFAQLEEKHDDSEADANPVRD